MLHLIVQVQRYEDLLKKKLLEVQRLKQEVEELRERGGRLAVV
jgi:microcompartment protein CcmK/EutM